jgi:hypothetical protein
MYKLLIRLKNPTETTHTRESLFAKSASHITGTYRPLVLEPSWRQNLLKSVSSEQLSRVFSFCGVSLHHQQECSASSGEATTSPTSRVRPSTMEGHYATNTRVQPSSVEACYINFACSALHHGGSLRHQHECSALFRGGHDTTKTSLQPSSKEGHHVTNYACSTLYYGGPLRHQHECSAHFRSGTLSQQPQQ